MEGGDDLAQAWATIDDVSEIVETFEERIKPEFAKLSPEQVRAPLLDHVGIVDLNKGWDAISQSVRDDLTFAYQAIGPMPVWSARYDLEEPVFNTLGIECHSSIKSTEQYYSIYDQHSYGVLRNEFYPVAEGSFIDVVANTELWRRTLGIPQLGWKDNYPLENIHSRGSHQLFVATSKARVMQGLHSACPDKLVRRLRNDFTGEPFYDESMSDEEISQLATRLAVLIGMTHDIYTPAGGDMMKHIMDMDEEKDAAKLLDDGDERVSEFISALESQGLTRQHMEFAIRCIQGASGSLVGEMIHSEKGDMLEQDRLAYTVQDLYSAGVLGPAIARDLLDDTSISHSEDAIIAAWHKTAQALSDSSIYVAGVVSSEYPRPSLSLLDVSDDYILDDSLELVCTRPDKLMWLAALRGMMSANFYQGAKLRGQEHELSLVLKRLKDSGRANAILDSSHLTMINNRQLSEELREIGDPELTVLLDDMDKIIYPRSFESEIVPVEADTSTEWFSFRISIKPGLDTLVAHEGEVMSLGAYAALRRDSLAVIMLEEVVETFDGKKRIIRKVPDDTLTLSF